MQALYKCWAVLPPPALALRRIGAVLGLKEPTAPARAKTADAALREAMSAGFPVYQGRPDDPMLAFLDLPPTATPH